jgi:hypothetical protein
MRDSVLDSISPECYCNRVVRAVDILNLATALQKMQEKYYYGYRCPLTMRAITLYGTEYNPGQPHGNADIRLNSTRLIRRAFGCYPPLH